MTGVTYDGGVYPGKLITIFDDYNVRMYYVYYVGTYYL